jgi:deazaflavin-dependent oxidoreductase (nitroreductase family)
VFRRRAEQRPVSTRLGRRTARFNRRVTNRLTGRAARRLPGFGVVVHRGRKSGRQYETPVNVFRAPGGCVIALTYGAESEWVKNVLAAGGCELITRGDRQRLVAPEVFRDDELRSVPTVIRPLLRFMRVTEFLRLRSVSSDSEAE